VLGSPASRIHSGSRLAEVGTDLVRTGVAVLDQRVASRLQPRRVLGRRLGERARYCLARGSMLYGELLQGSARDVLGGGPCWEVLRGHEGDPAGSALAMRFMASVHRLVLQGRAGEVAEYYPSVGGDRPPAAALNSFLHSVDEHVDDLRRLVNDPVQTNEVGRCAALLGGFLLVAHESGLPLRLLELGASAGLNLRWDRYRYVGSGLSWGDPTSSVVIEWALRLGAPHVDVTPLIVERRGCDLHPLDPTSAEGRIRLMSYIWPDQLWRLRLLRRALDLSRTLGVEVDRANAPDWVASRLRESRPYTATVVYHSIVMQFLSRRERRRVHDIIERAGRAATPESPLAWLRMEGGGKMKEVLVTSWPGGRERRLASAGLYGRPIQWLANEASAA